MIRNHVHWVQRVKARFHSDPDFEIVTSSPLALFSFRFAPAGGDADALTTELLERVNNDGRIFLTPSEFGGLQVIRMTPPAPSPAPKAM